MTTVEFSIAVEIGPERVRLWQNDAVKFDLERRDPRPFLASIGHDCWLLSHLRERLSAVTVADFPAVAAELDAVLARLGARLAEAYLPRAVRQEIVDLIAEAERMDRVARIGLRLASPEDLGALPWEALVLDGLDDPVALSPHVDFVRIQSISTSLIPGHAYEAPILLAAAFPTPPDSPSAPLDAAEEQRLIETMLTAPDAAMRAGCYFIQPSAEAIAISLRGSVAHIFHISTHGDTTGIEVESALGYTSTLTSDDLVNAVRSAKRSPLLVFLSSCLSGGSPDDEELSLMERLVEVGVPAVIGMRVPVSDQYARTFAAAFYGHLVSTNPTTVAGAFCQARRDTAYAWRHAQDLGRTVVPAEWATPLLLLTQDVMFVDSHSGGGDTTFVVPATTPSAVSRAPIQRQLRQAILHPQDGLHTIYGVAGAGKTTEVDLAIASCRMVIGYEARIKGSASPESFLSALAVALRSPAKSIPPDLQKRARNLADQLPDMDAAIARQRIEKLLSENPDKLRLVMVWDAFEDNLVPVSGAPGPLHRPFKVGDPALHTLLETFAQGLLIRLLIVSRYPIIGASGFNIGLMTQRQSDELIRIAGRRQLVVKEQLWRSMRGHPLGIRTALEILERDPGRPVDEIIQETSNLLREHAGLVRVMSRLSPYARDLVLRAAVFQVPVHTGALVWIMLSFGPRPDEATAARLKLLADIIGDLPFESGDVFFDWRAVTNLPSENLANLAADLDLDPWLKLSRSGQLAAIHELLSHGLLAVDSGETSENVLKVVAPRFVADYLAQEWPDETEEAHVRAMHYWLDPSLDLPSS